MRSSLIVCVNSMVCNINSMQEEGRAPTPPPRRSVAGGLKVAQAQAMAVAVGCLPDPRRSPLLHRASFHGRGHSFTILSTLESQFYDTDKVHCSKVPSLS